MKLIFLICWLALFRCQVSVAQIQAEDQRTASLGEYIRSICKECQKGMLHKKTVAFFLRFEDFGCLACFESFIDCSDSLNSYYGKYGRTNTVIIFPHDDDKSEKEQRRLLAGWAKANNIKYSIYLVPAKKFSEYYLTYSSVILIDEKGLPRFNEKLPLAFEALNRILDELFSKGRKR